MEDEKTNKVRTEDAGTDSATDALPAPLTAQALEKTRISKYYTKGGHGFAAEDANHVSDTIRGKKAEIVGTSNEFNGADRIVDGVRVQSKYFQTAPETVAAAFDSSSGNYRYPGQVLEVPKDQYETCVELMRDRIAKGKVPGFENPQDAEKIVRKGTVTYKQARNIARAGNIDSLMFDTKTQAVTCTYVFALSFAVNFAQGRWSGQSTEDAMRAAFGSAFATGGTTLIIGVLSAQLLRTRAAAIGAVNSPQWYEGRIAHEHWPSGNPSNCRRVACEAGLWRRGNQSCIQAPSQQRHHINGRYSGENCTWFLQGSFRRFDFMAAIH